jgi:hypothetical protein
MLPADRTPSDRLRLPRNRFWLLEFLGLTGLDVEPGLADHRSRHEGATAQLGD